METLGQAECEASGCSGGVPFLLRRLGWEVGIRGCWAFVRFRVRGLGFGAWGV